MTDIVERLRLLQSGAAWVCGATAATLEDAADEIERLQEVIARGLSMREAQAAYFKQRNQKTLFAALALEKDFDRAARAALGEDRA
jgi:hypothetical protein